MKCSDTTTKLILILIPWPSITARSDADAAQEPKDSFGFAQEKKRSLSSSRTPGSQTLPEKALSTVRETLCCASLFLGCVMGKAEQGSFVSVTFQSRISVSCSSPISCHRVIAGWFVSMAVPLPAWPTALFHVVHWGLGGKHRSWPSTPLAAGPFHLLTIPSHFKYTQLEVWRAQRGLQTVAQQAIKQVISSPGWCVRTLGCPNE